MNEHIFYLNFPTSLELTAASYNIQKFSVQNEKRIFIAQCSGQMLFIQRIYKQQQQQQPVLGMS